MKIGRWAMLNCLTKLTTVLRKYQTLKGKWTNIKWRTTSKIVSFLKEREKPDQRLPFNFRIILRRLWMNHQFKWAQCFIIQTSNQRKNWIYKCMVFKDNHLSVIMAIILQWETLIIIFKEVRMQTALHVIFHARFLPAQSKSSIRTMKGSSSKF